ncbi:MAG: hypothetical protein JSU05_03950 [Bacteroidetes bacterium]|nr:hypothetical protein [Bacteroidota bacterium]
MKKLLLTGLAFIICSAYSIAQKPDAAYISHIDTLHYRDSVRIADSLHIVDSIASIPLRIININPYFTQHVDSMLQYQFEINKEPSKYYWYLKNSPVGLRINKDNGLLTFKAEKSYFLSGKLKYDYEYKVSIGVQSLSDPKDKVDTSFTLVFYNTEIVPSKVKPTVSSVLTIDEGDTLSFKVQCETGSFPIENILFTSSTTIKNFSLVEKCNDEFRWSPGYDFVKDTDPDKSKTVILSFIGSTRFQVRDTANVKVIVKDALDYPLAVQDYSNVVANIKTYTLQLKYSFLQLDKKLKHVKNARTSFDLTSAATALTGTILNTSTSTNTQTAGKVLPSVGVALVPIKEATAPNKGVEQNQAALIRTSIKRLEYMIQDNMLVGERDSDVLKKTAKLKDELKQIQVQLIDIPIEIANNMTEKQLNDYFNSPKVNKKYRLKG